MPAWFIMQTWPHSAHLLAQISSLLSNRDMILADGDYKIYEILAIVGYSSQSNFARNFLKQFNMTPTEYMQSSLQKKKKE